MTSAQKTATLRSRALRRNFVDRVKQLPCTDCGERFHPVVMDFHHVDPDQKVDAISAMVKNAGMPRLKAEIRKCVLLCANCHRLREIGLRKVTNMAKTATIKLRLEEDEKLNWEAQATADGVSLSSLIRHRMNHPTTRADGGLVPAPERDAQDFVFGGPPGQGSPSLTDHVGRRLPFITSATASSPGERRSTECEHGRPQYAYCPTCD